MDERISYDEEKGILDFKHRDGSVERFFMVPPKTYEKYYDAKSPEDFVRRVLRGQFASVRI